jgi:hypothetical protein
MGHLRGHSCWMRRRRWRRYAYAENWYGLDTFLTVSSRVRGVFYGLIVLGALLCALVLILHSIQGY